MELQRYLSFKFGHYTGSLDCILYMLKASFYAPTFRRFWQNWNPLWSYYLLYYLYQPMSKKLSQQTATFFTFLLSGFIHDCVAMIIMSKPSIIMTLSFSIAALIVLLEKRLGVSALAIPKVLRPIYHIFLITLSALPVAFA